MELFFILRKNDTIIELYAIYLMQLNGEDLGRNWIKTFFKFLRCSKMYYNKKLKSMTKQSFQTNF